MKFKYIEPETEEGKEIYSIMERLIQKFHPELMEAKIALAWNFSWKPDKDGHLVLGKCKKAGDLEKSVPSPFDFIITLFKPFWEDPAVSQDQMCALLDHELCHATARYDDEGELLRDEKGNIMYRTRKHDVEDFIEIIERYGVHTPQLERLAFILRRLKVKE